MSNHCIICDHPRANHWGSGCHKNSFLRGSCDCTFVEPPPLPASATAGQYRERAGWWEDRVRITDDKIWQSEVGSARYHRLAYFRRSATNAAKRAREMAELTEAQEVRERVAREAADAAAARDAKRAAAAKAHQGLLDGISLATLQEQPLCTLGMYEEEFDLSSPSEQLAVRNRVAAEFNVLPPVERRELLEDKHVRDLLEHLGVVSRWTIGLAQEHEPSEPKEAATNWPEAGTPEWADEIVRIANDPAIDAVFEEARRKADAHMRFVQQLDAEYGDTVGDTYWAQTEAEDPLPRDEAFIAAYDQDREKVEAYWRNWALAPSPMLQQALMRSDPENFKRHMTIAIQMLTPDEKFCFASHDELFGWIVSGMKPLIVDGRRVPLDEVIEPRYLSAA